jgi:hypothetical protein
MMLSLNARTIRKAQHAPPPALPRSWEVPRHDFSTSVSSSGRLPAVRPPFLEVISTDGRVRQSTTDLDTPDYPQYALIHRDGKSAVG